MRYSTFRRDIEAMGYSIFNGKNNLFVKDGRHSSLMSVGFRSTYIIDSNFELFRNLEDSEKERLLNLAWQLASTPIEERKDEKRYQLRLPFLVEVKAYLNEFHNGFFMGDRFNVNKHKTIFTESEIKELKQEHNLDSFILEEVKEDE